MVAGEVKDLAQETAKATEDIGRRIEAIQADTTGAVDAIEQISEVIGQISDYQTTIASAVEEQTVTTNEMSRSVAEAAAGSTEIAANVAGVAEAAGRRRAAAWATGQRPPTSCPHERRAAGARRALPGLTAVAATDVARTAAASSRGPADRDRPAPAAAARRRRGREPGARPTLPRPCVEAA